MRCEFQCRLSTVFTIRYLIKFFLQYSVLLANIALYQIISGIQNIPNPDNCNMYYRCVNGVRTTMTCSNGLLFDRKFGDCNISERVICEVRNRICEPFVASLVMVTIGNPVDCSRYVMVVNISMASTERLFYQLLSLHQWKCI